MFGSALSYIALRLLGEGEGEGHSHSHMRTSTVLPLEAARKWILHHGGAVGIPSWGKFWLSVTKPICQHTYSKVKTNIRQ